MRRTSPIRTSWPVALAAIAGWLLPAFAAADEPAARYAGNLWSPAHWLPPNHSDIGVEIDNMLVIIGVLTTVVLIAVLVCMVAFLFLYRERAGSARKARYTHGNNTVELIWTAIPAVILVVLAFMSEGRWRDAKKAPPKGESNVYHIKAKQFAWEIYYPGRDGAIDTEDDFKVDGMLYLEKDKPAMITLTSHDVIHSFFLPDFRVKQDAMPGRDVRVWFTPKTEGRFQIACAEFCGNGHTNMKGSLQVLNHDDFVKTMEEQTKLAEEYGKDEGW